MQRRYSTSTCPGSSEAGRRTFGAPGGPVALLYVPFVAAPVEKVTQISVGEMSRLCTCSVVGSNC